MAALILIERVSIKITLCKCIKQESQHIKHIKQHQVAIVLLCKIKSNKSDLNWQQNHNQSPRSVPGFKKALSQDADWLNNETVKEALKHAGQVGRHPQRSRRIELRPP